MSRSVVVALGGNALTPEGEAGTSSRIEGNADAMASGIGILLDHGWRVVVVHGNGPQVGNLAIQQEEGAEIVPRQPLYTLTAMTQGQLGSIIARAIDSVRGADTAACLVTHVLVDPEDPAFEQPSKPIGPFFSPGRAEALGREHGWVVRSDSGRGHRRMVASPAPVRIVETPAIVSLLDDGHVVLAAGGGGVPVHAQQDGRLNGVDAVIDKDLAAARVATAIDASAMLLITGVDAVSLDFGSPEQRTVRQMSVQDAEHYMRDGQFPPGSMGPKITAALDFLRGGGDAAVITSVDKMADGLDPDRDVGTRIVGTRAKSQA